MAGFADSNITAGKRAETSGNGGPEGMEPTQRKVDVVVQSIRRLLRRGAISHLTNLIGRLHPVDVAQAITHLSTSQEKCTRSSISWGETRNGPRC